MNIVIWVGPNAKRSKRFSSANGAKTEQTVRGARFFFFTFGTKVTRTQGPDLESEHIRKKKFMVTGGTRAAAGGPRQSAETGNARAETLGPDGGQQTWKPGPGGAEGPTDAKESPHILFPLSMPTPAEGWGGRGRASGHGRGGWQARREGAARGAAGSGNSGGGTGDQGLGVDNSAAWDAGRQQRHKAGREPGQRRVKRRGAKVRYDTWHGLGGLP